MKRTCNDCRALTYDGKCSLNYKNDVKTVLCHIVVEYKPLEECSKPKTYEALMSEYKWD